MSSSNFLTGRRSKRYRQSRLVWGLCCDAIAIVLVEMVVQLLAARERTSGKGLKTLPWNRSHSQSEVLGQDLVAKERGPPRATGPWWFAWLSCRWSLQAVLERNQTRPTQYGRDRYSA